MDSRNGSPQTAQLPLPPALKLLRATYPVIERLLPPLAKRIGIDFFLKPFKFPPPEREKGIAAKAVVNNFQYGGETVYWYKWGHSLPYVVCVHGWSGRATQFHALIENLTAKGISVVSFDAPAHGKSTGKSTNLIEFSECIDHLVQENGIAPTAIIGHSLGGIATMLYQRTAQSKIPQITINSPAIVDEILENYAFRLNARKEKISGWLEEYVLKRVGRPFREISGEFLSIDFPETPFLICIDTDDREVSMKNADLLKQNIPSAEVFVTESFGHVRILRAEVFVEKVTDFILNLPNSR